MIQIRGIINSIFSSMTYVLYREEDCRSWVVDIGDAEDVLAICKNKGLVVEGVFLTHGHFDHIYGLKSLVDTFPSCEVYVSAFGKESLASKKKNLSCYHDTPFSYTGDNVIVVRDGDTMRLFEGEPGIEFYETPGHNPGCLTMVVGDMIFTGDAYIPGIKVNTQLPGANKAQAAQSLERIMKLAEGRKIFPGHYV